MKINSEIIKNYKLDILLYLIISIIGTFFIVPKYFDGYITPLAEISPENLWQSLDPSWTITLNFANNNNLIWGKDFIYTYGPLGFLSTRVGWGVNIYYFIIFDLIVFFNFLYIYFTSLKNSNNKTLTFILLATNFVLIPVLIGPGYSHILLSFLVFWILQNTLDVKIYKLFFQILLLTLIFFVKFNTAIIALPLFYLGILYLFIGKKMNRYKLIIFGISPIFTIIISSFFLNVNIYEYISTAFEIISGYNDIMYVGHSFVNKITAIIIISLVSLIYLYNFFINKTKDYLKLLFNFSMFIIPIFVLYKSGFVRGLETDFFIYSTMFFIVNYEIHQHKFKLLPSLTLIVCLGLISYQVFVVNKLEFNLINKTEKFYLSGLKSYTPTSSFKIIPNNNQLPDKILKTINKSKTDVIPWNSQMAFENQLNFYNRPVFQSFTAYTDKLEKINFDHYNNNITAPQFVLFDYTTIDSRYPLFDESLVNLALLKNYFPIKIFDYQGRKMLLFKKNSSFKPIKLVQKRQYAMLLDSYIIPEKEIYYKIEIYNSLKGKIYSIFNHAPEIKLEIESYKTRDYHIGSKLLQSGIFGCKHITNTEEYYNLFFKDSIKSLSDIKKYRINFLDTSKFKDKIKITEYEIKQ